MSIEVHVRIRPHVSNSVWSSAETVLYSTHNPNTRYVYNKVHHIGTSNQTIFQGIEALVHAGFDGKNVTVMAYGQTGSGKTHSMNGNESDLGIVPRTAKLLLDLRKNFPGTQIVMYFTEIYNESVKDLLEPQRGELALHDAPDGGVLFDKKSVPIETMNDFAKLQSIAERNRKYGVTNLNDHSSRSHMILTFEIHRGSRQVSTINLVDLAGSESASRANTEGLSLREGGFINKSLLTLGNVVDAIVEKRTYVPYRDAKLTRILRNCLGGSGMTFILCCIHPGQENFEQTVSSLRFTQRAMRIKNDPVMLLNMPPLFTHEYSHGAADLVRGIRGLCGSHYQRGLREAFLYAGGTLSAAVSQHAGEVSGALQAMATAQRLLLAHDHAVAGERLAGGHARLAEGRRRRTAAGAAAAGARRRGREAAAAAEERKAKVAKLEAAAAEAGAVADTALAGWEYQLYEARQRRIAPAVTLRAAEAAARQRLQYEWAVCVERIAARCVPAIKALGPITHPVADKHAVLAQMRQRLQKARSELADLTVAHDMIKADLPEMRRAVAAAEGSPAPCPTPSAASLSPQPRPIAGAIEADATDTEIDNRIHELEREEKILMSRAMCAARRESTRRIRESLREPGPQTPPTTRSAVRHHDSSPQSLSQQHHEQEQSKHQARGMYTGVVDTSPTNARGGTGCYSSPLPQRSPTPRTARTVFPTADMSPEAESLIPSDLKGASPRDEQFTDGVRRALGVLRDVRTKLMRPVQERHRRAAHRPSAAPSPTPETARSGSRRCRRTESHTPQDDDVTLVDLYMRKGNNLKEEEPIIGIAARRRREGAPVRPNVERALWRLSLSPATLSIEPTERSRSRRR
ncbi:kinesin [Trypanosoma theileri]|uniref:Kinesin-like protein n=1 Tax=Trypanosoma theileri TaxID=67003 RepID=A0A1X0P4H8_9TRYP|nr:kinesin [Trypanosoma theileri]ORC91553.1 kinesin [Trypanosoma theileri]